ncbi:MAG TPA: hypothetical protein VGP64_09155 [Polyangia bacterium]
MAVLRTLLRTFLPTLLRSWTRRPARALRLALLLGSVPLASCFNPAQPACAFSCAGDGLCPSGYTCGGDLICHRTDGQGGACPIQTDAAPKDATATDATATDATPADSRPADAARD